MTTTEIMARADAYAEKMMGVANYVKGDAHIEARAVLQPAIEALALQLDAEQIDTVRRDVLMHDAAALIRSQAAEIERLKTELKDAERRVINRTAAMNYIQNASDAWCEAERKL